jgi:hypothetical protein
MEEPKYKLEVKIPPTPVRVSKERIAELKGLVKGKMLSRMKREAVECPVKGHPVAFIECFGCKNFIRRVRGQLDCRGEPL